MAIQPRFRVYDYFHIYWSNFKILFYACVVEGCSASLTIAREKQTSNLFHLRWSSVENRVSRDVLTGKVYCITIHKFKKASHGQFRFISWQLINFCILYSNLTGQSMALKFYTSRTRGEVLKIT